MKQLLRDYLNYREKELQKNLKTDRIVKADPYTNVALLKEIQAVKELITIRSKP